MKNTDHNAKSVIITKTKHKKIQNRKYCIFTEYVDHYVHVFHTMQFSSHISKNVDIKAEKVWTRKENSKTEQLNRLYLYSWDV